MKWKTLPHLMVVVLGLVLVSTELSAQPGAIAPEAIEGRWEGFVATPSASEYAVLRISLDFTAATTPENRNEALSTAQETGATRQELNALRQQLLEASRANNRISAPKRRGNTSTQYNLVGDEIRTGFSKAFAVSMTLEAAGYVHPGFEETERGEKLVSAIENRNRLLRGTARVSANLNTQTGELSFGNQTRWDRQVPSKAISPSRLRLLFDPEKQILLGKLLDSNNARRNKTLSTAYQTAVFPVLLWREGQVPQDIDTSLGEAMNLSTPTPVYALSKSAQIAAIDFAASEEGQAPDPAPRAPSRRGADLRQQPIQETFESDAFKEVQREYEDAKSNTAATKQAWDEAKVERGELRDARRDLTGQAREAANQAYKDANARVRELQAAYTAASKAEITVSKRYNEIRRVEKDNARDIDRDKDRKRKEKLKAIRTRPAPDISTTPAQIIAWMESLGEAFPALSENGRTVTKNYWPNAGQNLFSDEATQKAFGQTLPEWSAGDRWFIYEAVRRSNQTGRRDDDIPQLPDDFDLGYKMLVEKELFRNFPKALARYYLHKSLRTYAASMNKRVNAQPVDQLSFLRLESWESIADEFVAQLWPRETQAVLDGLKATRRKHADPVLMARVDAAIATSATVQYPAYFLTDWWVGQGDFQSYASQAGKDQALARLNRAVDDALSNQLSRLTAQVSALGQDVAAIMEGGALYRQANAIAGRAADRPAYTAFRTKLVAKREQAFARAQDEIEAQLGKIETIAAVDQFVTRLLSMPEDRRSKAGRQVYELADARRAQIDEKLLRARFSEREQLLMDKETPGILQVPSSFSAPDAQEVRFAFYRDAGQNHEDDPDSVLMSNPMGELLNLYVEFEMSDVEVIQTLKMGNAYWVLYSYNQRLTPKGWAYEEFEKSPYDIFGAAVKMAEYDTVYTFDRFELTRRGWRSSTVNRQFSFGLSRNSLRKDKVFLVEMKKAIRNEAVDPGKARAFLQDVAFFVD